MKVLSVRNPWGFCIVKGWKDVENRSWRTNFRGRTMIHIPQKIDKDIDSIFFKNKYQLDDTQYQEILKNLKPLTGAIIGEVDIVDVKIEYDSIWSVEHQIQWVLKNPIIYDKPIFNIRGQLGFWNYPKQ